MLLAVPLHNRHSSTSVVLHNSRQKILQAIRRRVAIPCFHCRMQPEVCQLGLQPSVGAYCNLVTRVSVGCFGLPKPSGHMHDRHNHGIKQKHVRPCWKYGSSATHGPGWLRCMSYLW